MTALVLLVGGLGGLARYELGGAVQRRVDSTRPWGTAVVNLCGAGALGLLAGLHGAGVVGAAQLEVLGTGFLGGFTTFSTWMVESVRLSDEGGPAGLRAGLANLVGMALAGLAAAAVGVWAGAWVAS